MELIYFIKGKQMHMKTNKLLSQTVLSAIKKKDVKRVPESSDLRTVCLGEVSI